MEFLLQMFAEFLGSPSIENEDVLNKEIQKETIHPNPAPVQNEPDEEDALIFGLMQFH